MANASLSPNNAPPIRKPGNRGGDFAFITGKGAVETEEYEAGEDGSFIFKLADGTEIIKILGNGEVSIKGKVIDDDRDLVTGLKIWLGHCNVIHPSITKLKFKANRLEPLIGKSKEGNCPKCGDPGVWINMGLVCPTHGKFMG